MKIIFSFLDSFKSHWKIEKQNYEKDFGQLNTLLFFIESVEENISIFFSNFKE